MRAPDITGPAAKGWKVAWPDPGASVGTWMVTGNFHPHWSWWAVLVIHLRQIDGLPPPVKEYPGAEYEFQILSMSPDHPVDIDAFEQGEDHFHYLTPPDCVVQFGGLDDITAGKLAGWAAKTICGGVSPDSDYRASWTSQVLIWAQQARTGNMALQVAGA